MSWDELIPAKSFIKPRWHPIKGEIKEKENRAERPSRCSPLQSAYSVADVENPSEAPAHTSCRKLPDGESSTRRRKP